MKSLEQCPVCGGQLIEKEVEKILRGGNHTAVLQVAAEVCESCGERGQGNLVRREIGGDERGGGGLANAHLKGAMRGQRLGGAENFPRLIIIDDRVRIGAAGVDAQKKGHARPCLKSYAPSRLQDGCVRG